MQTGEVLLRLNDTQLRAERTILQRRLDKGRVRRARLVAERDGAEAISFGADLLARAERGTDLAELMAGETRLFKARTSTYLESWALLQSRITQIEHEIAGFEGQIAAATRQNAIVRAEMDIQRDMFERGLERRTPLVDRQLEAARIDRDLASFASRIAGSRSRIGEHRISLSRLDAERLEAVVTELRELDVEILDLEDELLAVDDELSDIDVTAPVDGIVHASTVHTPGAVIRPADSVLAIVPQAERLVVEARVAPASIDDIRHDQAAMVRFPAFNARTTPELAGVVERVSPDRMVDEVAGQHYYAVEIAVSPGELERLDGRSLIPGMPAEVFVRTAERTPLSYLVKPLSDHLRRALRED